MEVVNRIRNSLRHLQVPDSARILIGVSGGIDSMTLLHALHLLGFPVTASHVNFQLRGAESDQDEQHVLSWCKENGITCLIRREDTQVFANMHGINIQQAARRIRYDWWNELVSSGAYDYIATAHHEDDNIETILMNFMRGTGIKGFIGIPSKRYQIIRPMLTVSRKDIVDYAEANGIPWREDSSNGFNYYLRNRVRHHLIPYLQDIMPGIKERIKHTAIRTTLEWNAWERMYWEWVNTHVTAQDNGYVIRAAPGDEGIVLRWLEMKGLPWPLAHDYIIADRDGGEPMFYMDFMLSRTREGFFLRKSHERYAPILIEGPGKYAGHGFTFTIDTAEPDEFSIEAAKSIAFITADVVQFPLTLRLIRKGDVFQPLGMEGKSKKLQDLLVDRKFEVHEKQEVWVLTNASHILWVVGVHLDERAKVTPGDALIYKLVFEKP